MDHGRFISRRTSFVSHLHFEHQEDSENSPENSGGGDSPRFSMLLSPTKQPAAAATSSSSSPRKSSTSSKRSAQKRLVVTVAIKDVEGSRTKGEMAGAPPPSDSWAWRKYGQKPIKGSPYPRGYYRCSSSKGCPAKKQVERSRVDPNMLLVTYSCDHNHAGPATKNKNLQTQIGHNSRKPSKSARKDANSSNSEEDEEEEEEEEEEKQVKFASQAELINKSDGGGGGGSNKVVAVAVNNTVEGSSLNITGANDHVWFSEFECTTSTILETPLILNDQRVIDHDDDVMAMAFTMRDEDEAFFADLGELPECSTVFRRGMMERDEESRRLSMAPLCGTTG